MSDSWRASSRAIHTRTPRGGVVLDPVTRAYFVLNETGEVLWKVLEGGAAEGDLVDALCREFEVEPSTAMIDVASWLTELSALDLVHRVDAPG